MAQNFKETAHLKTNQKAFEDGWERVFGKHDSRMSERHEGYECEERKFPRDEIDEAFKGTEFFKSDDVTTLEAHWALKGFREGYKAAKELFEVIDDPR